MNPYLARLKSEKALIKAVPKVPEAPSGTFGTDLTRGIQKKIPPGILARVSGLVDAGAWSEAAADELRARYWTNPDVWESTLFAAERSAGLLRCYGCARYRTPGLTGPWHGHCGGGRDELPPAYGETHPLRLIPRDGGHDCAAYVGRSGVVGVSARVRPDRQR